MLVYSGFYLDRCHCINNFSHKENGGTYIKVFRKFNYENEYKFICILNVVGYTFSLCLFSDEEISSKRIKQGQII
jgi:hypothetical protein